MKSYIDFVKHVSENGLPDAICFDHDLGEDVARLKVKSGVSKKRARIDKKQTKSGMDCAKWLVDYCMKNKIDLPPFNIHSNNPSWKENIMSLLNSFQKHFK